MKKAILSNIALTLSAIIFVSPALAQVDQCAAPPAVQSPRTCTISTSGGVCSFGYDEDGIVKFPDHVVNGNVTISGGRNVHLIGGHIVAPVGEKVAVAFNYPQNVFIEGTRVDANGQCDAFAIRNHRLHQLDFTFQNVFVEGPAYNILPGCHGDLIQYQGSWPDYTAGGFSLHIENFVGVTNGQGIFIPWREQTGSANADFRNVYVRTVPNPTYPLSLLWFWAPQYDPDGKPYPVKLDNVWMDYAGAQVMPTGVTENGVMSFPDEPLIDGVVNQGFNVNEEEFKAKVGLNYDRAAFCANTAPDPTAETGPALEPDPTTETDTAPDTTTSTNSSLNIANATTMVDSSANFDPANSVEGLWDGCVDGTATCSPGSGSQASFWVEYDLGQLYDLTQTRLFGDAAGGWVSKLWSVEYKENLDDPWVADFSNVDVFINSWTTKDLNVRARYVKLLVSGDAAVQAREFELFGTVAQVQTAEPDPAPEPSPDLTQADTVAPSVDFATPTNGGSVRRRSNAIITINAIDDVAVSDVELQIQGRRVARFSGPGPHSYEWKVRFRRKDTVTISAQATDMSGNRGEASVSVKLTN